MDLALGSAVTHPIRYAHFRLTARACMSQMSIHLL